MFTIRKCLSQKIDRKLWECFVSRKRILLKLEGFILTFICVLALLIGANGNFQAIWIPWQQMLRFDQLRNINKFKVMSRVQMDNNKTLLAFIFFFPPWLLFILLYDVLCRTCNIWTLFWKWFRKKHSTAYIETLVQYSFEYILCFSFVNWNLQ